jgi:O-acetyl-ADP-ribose deacetylase (regulator of RNase III)
MMKKKQVIGYSINFLNAKVKLTLLLDDITSMNTNAIVNPANSKLILGDGVAGAIYEKGGYSIQKECDQIKRRRGELETGEAVMTEAGNLSTKFNKVKKIIHAVGPYYKGGTNGEDMFLQLAFNNSLELCDKTKFTSVSFPPISSGIFKFPKSECARIFYECVVKYTEEKLTDPSKTLQDIRMCIFDDKTFQEFYKYHQLFSLTLKEHNILGGKNIEESIWIDGVESKLQAESEIKQEFENNLININDF